MRQAFSFTWKAIGLAVLLAVPFAGWGQRTDESARPKEVPNHETGKNGTTETQTGRQEEILQKYGIEDGTTPAVRESTVVKTPEPPKQVEIPTPVPKEEKPAFLGVHYEVSRTAVQGAYVTDVEPNTPASGVGLRRGDVITKADGKTLMELEDLVRVIAGKKAGEKVNLTVMRDGRSFNVSPALAVRDRDLMTFQYNSPDYGYYELSNGGTLWINDNESAGRPFLGVTFRREEKILLEDGEEIAKTPASRDLIVAEVMEGGTARQMGLQPGDVITSLNGRPVSDFETLNRMLQGMEVGQEIRLGYVRSGRPYNSVGRLRPRPNANPGLGMNGNGAMRGGPPAPDANEDFSMDRIAERMRAAASRDFSVSIHTEGVPMADAGMLKEKGHPAFSAASNLDVRAFSISPDANSGMYALTFELATQGNTSLQVFESEGNTVYTENLPGFRGSYRKEFGLPAASRGGYFVQISQNGRNFTRKVTLR